MTTAQLPRWRPRVNVVHVAATAVLVTAQYRGGWSGTVTLLVGPGDDDAPPTTVLGEMSSVTNSAIAGLVRAGERWMLSTSKEPGRGGLMCWASPCDG